LWPFKGLMRDFSVHLGWLGFAILLGCMDDRVAGTEVGNPEIIVARIVLMDQGDSVQAEDLNLKMMGAHFITAKGDSGHLWDGDSGTMFDLFDPGIVAAFPTKTMEKTPWSNCELELALPKGQGNMADTMTSTGFFGSNWARWKIDGIVDTCRYFFYLPDDFRIRLTYGQDAMMPWHSNDTLFITLNFNVGALAKSLPAGDWKTRLDDQGEKYVVLSPMENASAHAAILAELPYCFKADSLMAGHLAKRVPWDTTMRGLE
jgi:hypothetical protein